MTNARRFAAGCGIAAPAVALSAILLATVVADPETFTWSDRALSDLGRVRTNSFFLFNGGLIVAGVIGLPFAWRLRLAARNRLERLGAGCFGLAIVGMLLVGVFFIGHTRYYLEPGYHNHAALAFFGLVPVANWLLGAGALRAGDRRWGLATVAVGTLHVLTWLAWLGLLAVAPSDGATWFAVPEMVVAVLFGAWTAAAAVRCLRHG